MIPRKDELARYLATVACQTLNLDDPLEVYKEVSRLDKVIDNLTPEARNRLILEVLVFEIFSITYNCQAFNLPDDFLQKYHSNIHKLISENDWIMRVIRGIAFPKLLKYSGSLVITEDTLLKEFEESILMVRYSQYCDVLGGVRYPIDKHSLKHFRLLAAKNMFGDIPELVKVSTHVLASFDVSTEVVRDAIARRFNTTEEKQLGDIVS